MMKSIKCVTFILFGLSTFVATQTAMAVPGNLSLSLSCPDIGNQGSEKVVNSGTALTGVASERLHVTGGVSKDTHPLFAGSTPAGVPIDLVAGGYANSSTSYNASTNVVTCNFTSSSGNPPFSITYVLQNITNGIVTSAGKEEIKIKFNVGSYR